jgi:hypothetical protein
MTLNESESQLVILADIMLSENGIDVIITN